MIVLDTGPAVAMVNADDNDHERCTEFLTMVRGPIFLPEPLLGEIGYLLGTRCGSAAEAAFIRDTVNGSVEVVSLRRVDRARVAELVEKYGDLALGTADASVVAVAERFGISEIATLDHRHFTVVRPSHVTEFTLLP